MRVTFRNNTLEGIFDGTQNTKESFQARRKFISDPEERKTTFASYYNTVSVNDKWIFYESMGGMRMMDNPYAIFKQVCQDKRFDDYVHVWSIATYATIPEEYKKKDNILFVTRNTHAYMQALSKAKFIVCNSVLPEFFVPKPDQKYLNTWHGIAYKGIGRSELSPLGPMGTIYNMLEATHILTPCDFMTQKQLAGFSMQGVYSGQLAETGYPRIDTTINATAADKNRIRKSLGISSGRKVVLYAPTWRGDMDSRKFDTDTLVKDLKALADLDANVVFMGHHLMLRHTKGIDFGDLIIPPSSVNTNELLSVVDVLVTDYSSIFFDFLVTGRPIVHYVYDYEEYERERGLNLETSELPGVIAYTGAELISSVKKLLESVYIPTKEYVAACERFCPHDDGRVSLRTVEWFFADNSKGIEVVDKSSKKSIVFWAGALNSTEYALEYLRGVEAQIKKGDKIIVLVISRSVIGRPEIMDIIQGFGLNITLIARGDSSMLATNLEKASRRLIEHGTMRGWGRIPFVRNAYARLYQREYRRIFGNARFDEVILYEKSSRFWKELAKYVSK